MMKKFKYKHIGETLHHAVLDNGLNVFIVSKKGFSKTYSTFVTNFGASTTSFIPHGGSEFVDVPLGVAHFLEHKMFEMADGIDAMNHFDKMGADSNAFTDHNQTAYLVTATNNIKKVLNLLLDFVQTPHFTDENVIKEQGIIIQELMMYKDKPSSRAYLGLLQNLFKKHPMREDIVGTEESIKSISKEVLNLCYDTFYHPSNMYLMVVGDVNPSKILQIVTDNQNKKIFTKREPVVRKQIIEDEEINCVSDTIQMDIVTPKVYVGFKLITKKYDFNQIMIDEMMIRLLLEYIIGQSSKNYQYLLDNDLITTGLGYSVTIEKDFGYINIMTNSNKPDEFIDFIKTTLIDVNNHNIDQNSFDRMKKATIGSFIKSFNSLEYIANVYIDTLIRGGDLFSFLDEFEKKTKDDLISYTNIFKEDKFSSYIVLPKS